MNRLTRLSRYSYFIIGASLFFGFLVLFTHTVNSADSASATETDFSIEDRVKDSWLRGKIEGSYLFHRSLNPLDIDVTVENGKATLSGEVESDVQRDLAKEIALSIDGIETVDNQLETNPNVESEVREDGSSDLLERLSDSAVSAKVKTRLLANINIPGSDIQVETNEGVVTLSGNVTALEERELAYYTTLNTEGVLAVQNDIAVRTDP